MLYLLTCRLKFDFNRPMSLGSLKSAPLKLITMIVYGEFLSRCGRWPHTMTAKISDVIVDEKKCNS